MEVRMTYRNVVFSFLVVIACCVAAFAADFNGSWTAAIDTQVGVQNYTFTFKVVGEKVTGKAKSAFANADTEITEGVVKGDDITFVENLVYEGMPLRIVYKGKISGDEIKFTRNLADIADEPFVAKRVKQ
jgi:hypothetical protein